MSNTKNPYLLYAITEPRLAKEMTLTEQVEAAAKGGITCLQLRHKEADKETFYQEALAVKKITDAYGIPLIINDHVDIAAKVDAAGVHIGQSDMQLEQARKILGPDKIIGVSARTVELAQKAQAAGATYLGTGAVFGTTTKLDAKPLDFETLKAVCSSVSIPVVAIGGINGENVVRLKDSGISGAAIVSGIFGADDITAACKALKEKMEWIVE